MTDTQTVQEATAQGHEAAAACATKAGDGFIEEALRCIAVQAATSTTFTTEDIRAWANLAPHDARAWGGVMRRAQRLGYIEACGAVPVASSRGGLKTLWRAAQ